MSLPGFISEVTALHRTGRTYSHHAGNLEISFASWAAQFWLTNCFGMWTDTKSDIKNCGECGTRCSAGETCCDGHCVPLQDNCGGCGDSFSCAQNQGCCPKNGDYGCVNLRTDPDNCGRCDNRCDFSPSPVFRELVKCCDYHRCLYTEDFKSDRSHCGNCETDCAITCGSDCNCSRGHCCPKCTVWFDGAQVSDLGVVGGIVGGLLGGLTGGLLGGFLGRLFGSSIGPGCYPCSDINEWTGSHLECCDGRNCLDLDTELAHCGSCNNSCPKTGAYNKICKKGRCVCPPHLPHECPGECVNLNSGHPYCGRCGNACLFNSCCVYDANKGYSYCTQVSFESDINNCGACGVKCPGGWICCEGKCVNYESDPRNCGHCGVSCGPGEVCCFGFCVNTQNDSHNCGRCDYNCNVYGGFVTGRNDCCNGSCVNRQGDVLNCGSCGHGCAMGELCVQGKCVEDIPIG